MTFSAYLAPPDLEESLRKELKGITAQYGRLFLAEGPVQKVHWAQNIWQDPQIYQFKSLSDAAKKLRSLQKLWSFYPYGQIRKGALITSQLPFFSPKPLPFLSEVPSQPLGSWTLLDENTLLASPTCSSPFAQGEIQFEETKLPPSRAYLKLWELFTLLKIWPKPNQVCLEIGASPGSWTWVLNQLQAKIFAVDRAPLDPAIARLPNVSFLKKDAFTLNPSDFPKLDWLFSDAICYPEKLLVWLEKWLDQDINFVCTLKFQGNSGYEIIQEFEKIPNSRIFHLSHNKHELTWVRLAR
jgi:23S rRNA (cytidine2498-2'-O)-methyltransferase